MMALGPQGTVFVGSQCAGKVHAVVDRDGDHKADRVVVIASGSLSPMASRCATARSTSRRRAGSCGSTTSSGTSTRRLRRSSSVTACPTRRRPHVEVHRLRTRRPAVHVGRRAVQRLRLAPDGVDHPADEARRLGLEVFAEGVRNTVGSTGIRRRTSCGSPTTGATCSATTCPTTSSTSHRRRACTSASRSAIRETSRSRVRRAARLLDDRAARAEARRARRGDRLHVLHRQHVSRELQERGDHRRARVVEPFDAERLSRHGGAHGRTPRDRLRAVPRRLPAGVGTALAGAGEGRRQRPAGRRAADCRTDRS